MNLICRNEWILYYMCMHSDFSSGEEIEKRKLLQNENVEIETLWQILRDRRSNLRFIYHHSE